MQYMNICTPQESLLAGPPPACLRPSLLGQQTHPACHAAAVDSQHHHARAGPALGLRHIVQMVLAEVHARGRVPHAAGAGGRAEATWKDRTCFLFGAEFQGASSEAGQVQRQTLVLPSARSRNQQQQRRQLAGSCRWHVVPDTVPDVGLVDVCQHLACPGAHGKVQGLHPGRQAAQADGDGVLPAVAVHHVAAVPHGACATGRAAGGAPGGWAGLETSSMETSLAAESCMHRHQPPAQRSQPHRPARLPALRAPAPFVLRVLL